MPESQMGYQIRSASSAIPGRVWCRSSTSRSLPGSSSRRPYPPTATRATPASAPSRDASQRSALAVRRARSAAKEASRPGRAGFPCCPPTCRPAVVERRGLLEGPWAALAGTDPHHGVHRSAPHLAVADPPRLRGLDHDTDQVIGVLVVAEHLQPHFRDQVDL